MQNHTSLTKTVDDSSVAGLAALVAVSFLFLCSGLFLTFTSYPQAAENILTGYWIQ